MFKWLDPNNAVVGLSHVGGINIADKIDSFDLSISSVVTSHAGRYMCVVTAGGAEQGNTSDVTVQCKEAPSGCHVVLVGVSVVKWLVVVDQGYVCISIGKGQS